MEQVPHWAPAQDIAVGQLYKAVCFHALPSEAASAVTAENTGKKLELAAHSNCHFSTKAGTSLGSYGLMHLLTYSSRVQAVHNSAFIKC